MSALALLKGRTELALPGLAVAATVGFAASFLGEHYSVPAMLFALLLGMALNFLYQNTRSAIGIDLAARQMLRIGVALLLPAVLLFSLAKRASLATGEERPTLLPMFLVAFIIFEGRNSSHRP